MKADERLMDATPRPWMVMNAVWITADGGKVMFATDNPNYSHRQRVANVALTRLAVNSFEAAREALRLASSNLHANAYGTNGVAGDTVATIVRNALKLMDGDA